MMHLRIKRIICLALIICLAFASSTYVRADGDFPDASNTSLARTSLNMYYTDEYGAYGEVALVNAPSLDEYQFSYSCSNESLSIYCALDTVRKVITISAEHTGSGRITFELNNKVLYLDVKIIKVGINKKSLRIVKKKKTTLRIKGCLDKVKWVSKNKKVVTVSSKGVVKGKKIGNALVYAYVGGQFFGCAVSVVSKKMNTIVKKAYSIKKGKYSQPKRMLKGYYDCSSLVWRAYKKGKVKLVNKFYAPVAADIAKFYVKKKKRIKGGYSVKNVSKMILRPGDLFFCEGAKNKRYRGIYHVEMFTGYSCVRITLDGKATIAAKWATVPDDYYLKDHGLMVRPVK